MALSSLFLLCATEIHMALSYISSCCVTQKCIWRSRISLQPFPFFRRAPQASHFLCTLQASHSPRPIAVVSFLPSVASTALKQWPAFTALKSVACFHRTSICSMNSFFLTARLHSTSSQRVHSQHAQLLFTARFTVRSSAACTASPYSYSLRARARGSFLFWAQLHFAATAFALGHGVASYFGLQRYLLLHCTEAPSRYSTRTRMPSALARACTWKANRVK